MINGGPPDSARLEAETYVLYRVPGLSQGRCERLLKSSKRRSLEVRCARCLPDNEAMDDSFFPAHPNQCSMGELGSS